MFSFDQVLYWIGAAIFVKCTYSLLLECYSAFIRPGKNIVKTFGQWVVVTGATDGIGKAIAFEVAKQGCNVLLISRTQKTLDEVCAQIRGQHSVDVKTLAVDFSQFDDVARQKVSSAIADLDVGVLVNNVGASYPYPEFFDDLDPALIQHLIELNITSTTWMTKTVLGGMIARKRGAIVNMASTAGLSTMPLLAIYSATKSYIQKFSEALDAEYTAKGISVQCQVPHFVTSKLSKIRRSSLFVPTPKVFAVSSVKAIGYESVIVPHWSHRVIVFFQTSLPKFLTTPTVMNMHLGIRKKALKKKAAKAE